MFVVEGIKWTEVHGSDGKVLVAEIALDRDARLRLEVRLDDVMKVAPMLRKMGAGEPL